MKLDVSTPCTEVYKGAWQSADTVLVCHQSKQVSHIKYIAPLALVLCPTYWDSTPNFCLALVFISETAAGETLLLCPSNYAHVGQHRLPVTVNDVKLWVTMIRQADLGGTWWKLSQKKQCRSYSKAILNKLKWWKVSLRLFFEKFELFSSFTKRIGFKIDQCMN